ncbi:MAG: hypothetical protein ACXW39_03010 [Nitrospira sp.]
MVETGTALQREDLRVLHRAWPWLAYAMGLLLIEMGYQDAGTYVFALIMPHHINASIPCTNSNRRS